MQAGAKVRILELGRAETIDDIPSNWVKVEVQQGAKDRDGKPIKGGAGRRLARLFCGMIGKNCLQGEKKNEKNNAFFNNNIL